MRPRSVRLLVSAALALAMIPAMPARAAEPAWRSYPGALIDRPMTLPPMVFQTSVETGITNSSGINEDTASGLQAASGTGYTVSLGVDAGVINKLQAGMFLTVPVSPIASFGAIVFDFQYNLSKHLNVRLDLGGQRQLRRYQVVGAAQSEDLNSFVMGIGLPLKVRLNRFFAVVSGSTSARGFESPAFVAAGETRLFGAALANQDIFSLSTWSQGGSHVTGGALHLPVGILAQPHRAFSATLRAGYRMTFTMDADDTSVVHQLPIALDLVATPLSFIDIGFTGSLTGTIGGDSSRDYAAVRKFDIWVAARF